jgi:orotate phosphoribosyltransferase
LTEALEVFERCGVILRNSHLVYTSGRHGSEYVNKDALYPQPEIISGLCKRIAERFAADQIEVVLAPALGGIILTQWIAHHLQALTGKTVLALFAEKAETPDGFVLKRGYEKLITGKRTLIAEDILTTGGSVKKVVSLADKLGAQVVAVAALCNRGGIQPAEIGAPVLFSLVEISLNSWSAQDCPLCKQGVPIHQSLGKGAKT